MYRIILAGIFSISISVSGGQSVRECLVATAQSQVGMREATGNNDGPQVAMYLATCGLPEGYSYCGAAMRWVMWQNCVQGPAKAEWSPNWAIAATRTTSPRPGDTFTIYSYSQKRPVHVGMYITQSNGWISTSEANTNGGGSANGDGWYNRKRDLKTIYTFNFWTP